MRIVRIGKWNSKPERRRPKRLTTWKRKQKKREMGHMGDFLEKQSQSEDIYRGSCLGVAEKWRIRGKSKDVVARSEWRVG
jgi:hypothetical protein